VQDHGEVGDSKLDNWGNCFKLPTSYKNNIQYVYGVYFGMPKQNCKSDAANIALLILSHQHLFMQ
jgi:hypothetical protein